MSKKLFLLALLSGIFLSFSYGQETTYSLNIGLGSSTIYMDEGGSREIHGGSILSFQGGLIINYQLNNNLSLCSGVQLIRKGVKGALGSYGGLHVITPIDMNIIYLEIPLLLKFNIIQNSYFFIGPYLAEKIAGKLKLSGYETDRIKLEDIGYLLGLGIQFRLLNKEHSVEMRFSRGMTAAFSIGEDYKYYNIGFEFLYGIHFR